MTTAVRTDHAWPFGAPAGRRSAADEAAAVEGAADGDHEAFERLVHAHGRYVYNLTRTTLGDAREAEDAAQETFLRAWRGLAAFRAEAGVRTWLYRIAVNVCYDRLPRLRHDLALGSVDAQVDDGEDRSDDGLTLDEAVGRRELAEAVHAAIAELPRGYRLLLTLRHFDDLSYDEIVGVTGLPIGTVKTGIHRARNQLRARLAALAAPSGHGR